MYEHCPSVFGWVYKVFESISKDANSTSYTQIKIFPLQISWTLVI